MSKDENNRSHKPEGLPGGGQYEREAKPATGPALPADPLVGNLSITPGDSHFMSPYEAGTDLFENVEIVRDDDGGYRAEGVMALDMVDAFHEMSRFTDNGTQDLEAAGIDGYSEEQVERANTFLNDNMQLVESFLTDRYGFELDGGCDSWDYQRATFSVDLDPAVDTAGWVASRLETDTKAIDLYNETDAGTFGSPYVWRELADHVDRWEEDVFTARRGFAADTFSDQGISSRDADEKAADSSPDELDAAGAGVVRTFMADHHDLIEQAKRYHQEAYGEAYRNETVGRDLSLAIHNPADTPHGRLAFSALPPHFQARLQEAARSYTV